MKKNELMDKTRTEWNALMKVVDGMSEQQLVTPDEGGWSPKDNLAHLAAWMKILMEYHMDKRPAAEVVNISPEVAARWDFEEINQILFQRNRERSTKEVLQEIKDVYAKLSARLEGMSDEDLMKPRRADDPEKRPIVEWIMGDTCDHFEEHRERLEKSM
jgi:hypothetical protein